MIGARSAWADAGRPTLHRRLRRKHVPGSRATAGISERDEATLRGCSQGQGEPRRR